MQFQDGDNAVQECRVGVRDPGKDIRYNAQFVPGLANGDALTLYESTTHEELLSLLLVHTATGYHLAQNHAEACRAFPSPEV
jgi:hypothetical protein